MSDIVDPVLELYAEGHTTPPPPHLVTVDRETRESLDFPGMILDPSISIAVQLLFVIALSALLRHSPTRVRVTAVATLLLANSLGLFISPMVDALSAG